ncbi:MAG: NRDE family protein [Gammaproteobacteria bacterium]|jgi:uncharacterized protein with NRDE domain|nr:hypothetical protein [Rhodocyclaceae bacterium]
MCLVVFAWRMHPRYPLVLAANRDEFLNRPAAPAHWWTDAPELLAGRDLEAGGTWMGFSRKGRFAALTNYRDPSRHVAGAPSRGALVRGALEDQHDAAACLHALAAQADAYAAFNLLVGDGERLGVLESTTGTVRLLQPGVYGLSNHLLDTPWPKLVKARTGLQHQLAASAETPEAERATGEDRLIESLLQLMRDPTPAADPHLPETGVSLEWERWLSPAFIRAPGYGTRCSTVALHDESAGTRFVEWTWDAHGELRSRVEHRFKPV